MTEPSEMGALLRYLAALDGGAHVHDAPSDTLLTAINAGYVRFSGSVTITPAGRAVLAPAPAQRET